MVSLGFVLSFLDKNLSPYKLLYLLRFLVHLVILDAKVARTLACKWQHVKICKPLLRQCLLHMCEAPHAECGLDSRAANVSRAAGTARLLRESLKTGTLLLSCL